MKLNADLGERVNGKLMGMDADLMPMLDQANIACGMHAGDPKTMRETILLAKATGVEIGAHPSYPDPVNFGRSSMSITPEALSETLLDQILILLRISIEEVYPVSYVKPHGALYNDMMADLSLFETVVKVVAQIPLPLKLMILANRDHDRYREIADRHKVSLIYEAFADRAYTDDGKLVARSQANAVLNESAALEQVKHLVSQGQIISESGKALTFPVDSLCVHGDNPEALNMVARIRKEIL